MTGGFHLLPSRPAGGMDTNLGLAAHTFDPTQAHSTITLASGTCVFSMVRLSGATLSTLGIWIVGSGATSSGVNGLALYTEAGVLVDKTVDMTAAFTGPSPTWASALLAGGARTPPAGAYYLAALTHLGTAMGVAGVTAIGNVPAINNRRPAVYLAAQVDFPASFNPATASLNSGAYYMTAH